MSDSLAHPAVLISIVMGFVGVLLLVQARLQSRLLRRRIATGAGTVIVDAETGLFSSAAAWQCVRAEANRAARLERELDVWIAATDDVQQIEQLGRALTFELPSGATGIRLDDRHVCLVSCAAVTLPHTGALAELDWRHSAIAPGEGAALQAQEFIAEVTQHG